MADDVIGRVRARIERAESHKRPLAEGSTVMPAVPIEDLRTLLAVAEAARARAKAREAYYNPADDAEGDGESRWAAFEAADKALHTAVAAMGA